MGTYSPLPHVLKHGSGTGPGVESCSQRWPCTDGTPGLLLNSTKYPQGQLHCDLQIVMFLVNIEIDRFNETGNNKDHGHFLHNRTEQKQNLLLCKTLFTKLCHFLTCCFSGWRPMEFCGKLLSSNYKLWLYVNILVS